MLPLGLLIGGLVVVIATLLAFAALEQDDLAERSAQHLARSILGGEAEVVADYARDYGVWDASVANLVLDLNEAWASENIGTWAHDSLKMDATLVVDGADRPFYGMIDGVRIGSEVVNRITDGLDSLIAAVRHAGPNPNGVAVAGFVMVDGVPAVAAAAPIVWEDGRPAFDRGGAASVLIYMRTLDPDTLLSLDQRFLLPGLHFEPVDDAPDPHTFIPIETSAGVLLGRLAWTPDRPGIATLRPLMIPGAAALLVFGGLLWTVVHRAQRAVRELELSHQALRTQATSLAAARDRAEHQRALEVELRVQAVSASRSKSEFLALVSHELRTPLNAILGFSEIIAKQAFGPATGDRAQPYARYIYESGSHLLSLINDILDLSKVEAGRYELQDEDIPLGDLLERCTALLRQKAHEKAITLRCADTPIRIRADRRALKQVVINLLANAVKFTEPRGHVDLSAQVTDHAIEITIADDGVGMSKADLERSMTLFGQAQSPLTRSSGGTGLGLNISDALTKQHGGSLVLQSTPGEGTTAVIRLPLERLQPDAAP